jgi:predicted MPP superfamily phosphohydrolase
VYSVTGNHDYGNYRPWPSPAAKQKNFDDLIASHRLMGYKLLMNENHLLELDGERIAIIGVENWGTGRFPKYGNLAKAYAGTDEAAVKLLLSHDPSHWDAQIRPQFPNIDITFSGHTHGFQFGVEWGDLRWSPSQYVYRQWAGLYREGRQYLYVNRGFGFIGYPGRIGILPELTIVELERA